MSVTKAYLNNPIVQTDLARKVLRARLSLRETQTEFGGRFYVTRITIHNWETSKSNRLQTVHKLILESLLRNLKAEGRLIDEAILDTVTREQLESKQNEPALT